MCTACAPGQYQDVVRKTKCKACDNGEFVGTPAASTCEACPAGQYGTGSGATSCGLCAICATNQYINGTCTDEESSNVRHEFLTLIQIHS